MHGGARPPEARERQREAGGDKRSPKSKTKTGRGNRATSDRTDPGTKARDDAARAVGVSPRYVQDAKAVAEASPELAAQVRAGAITLPEAKRTLRDTRPAAPQPAKARPVAPPSRPKAPRLARRRSRYPRGRSGSPKNHAMLRPVAVASAASM